MKSIVYIFLSALCLLLFVQAARTQSQINDADGNTSVETNRLGLNDDIIWLRSGGLDRLRVKDARLEFLNTGGSIFIGDGAGLNDDLTNNLNMFIGDEAGTSTTAGAENVALGRRALFSNTTGDGNMAVGSTTLYRNTTGGQNAGIGKATLFENTTGSRNVGIGFSTLRNATTADDNVAIGSRAGFNTTTGAQNVLIGSLTGFNNQQGGQNVMIGYEAGRAPGAVHSKSGDVFIGYQAGYYETTSNKLYIENSNSSSPLIYGEFDNDLLRINGTLDINNAYQLPTTDGTVGQVLTTNGAGSVSWSSSGETNEITDADGDTKIQVEETADDDIVRIDIAGTEKFVFQGNRLEFRNTGNSTFVGDNAGMNDDLSNNQNVAVGFRSLQENTTGDNNVAIGVFALQKNTTGTSNTAIGRGALFENTSANDNSAVGRSALNVNTTGAQNTAVGAYSLQKNTTGSSNTAIGRGALLENTSASGNTAVGNNALYENLTGSSNTAVGTEALFLNTIGLENTATGYQSLYSNTFGFGNTVNGVQSLYSNTTGNRNTAIGFQSMYLNTTGGYNTSLGQEAMYSNITGSFNTAIGTGALFSNIDGSDNVGAGLEALRNNIDGNFNIAVGPYVMYNNTSGSFNSAFGNEALSSSTTAESNAAFGAFALKSQLGSYNTAIGVSAGDFGPDSLDNITAVGYISFCDAPNQVRIGNTFVTSIGGYANWSNASDQRIKSNIQENVIGLDFINALRPVTYTLDQNAIEQYLKEKYGFQDSSTWQGKYDASTQIRTGFLAQEVEAAAQSVGYDFSGVDAPKNADGFYGLRYAEFTVPLVKAVQELSIDNEKLKMDNEELKIKVAGLEEQIAENKAEKIDLASVLEEIQNLKSKIQTLESSVSFCCEKHEGHLHLQDSDRAWMEQNAPNPFQNETRIRYYLPNGTTDAHLKIFAEDGREIRQLPLVGDGLGSVTIRTTDLAAGSYRYALLIDGKTIDVKTMVISRN